MAVVLASRLKRGFCGFSLLCHYFGCVTRGRWRSVSRVVARKVDLIGVHFRNADDANKIYLSRRLIDGISGTPRREDRWWKYLFLLLATIAHEYGHWVRTSIFGVDDETPRNLCYENARFYAKEDEGECGYVAEVAIFGGFVFTPTNNQGAIRDFYLVDETNADELPVGQIKEFWNREYFDKLNLLTPLPASDTNQYEYHPQEPDPHSARKGGGVKTPGRIPQQPRSPYTLNLEAASKSSEISNADLGAGNVRHPGFSRLPGTTSESRGRQGGCAKRENRTEFLG
jgi:hypothetical protein